MQYYKDNGQTITKEELIKKMGEDTIKKQVRQNLTVEMVDAFLAANNTFTQENGNN